MKGRTPTAEEQRHINAVTLIGCLVCLLWENVYTPPEIHHTDGKTKKGAHFKIIPLCVKHHRGGRDCERYTSRHPHKKGFEERYAPETELLTMTKRLAGKNFDGELYFRYGRNKQINIKKPLKACLHSQRGNNGNQN